MAKQYVYISPAAQEPAACKIGITCRDLKERLNDYNSQTGRSKNNMHQYIFTCEVKNMKQVETDIKNKFRHLREDPNSEMYFYNEELFKDYVKLIKSHKMFVKEILIKPDDKKEIVKIIKRTTPSLEERGLTYQRVMQKAQKLNNDEFYTRYEDVEKELDMYDKRIWKSKVVFCNCDDAVDKDKRQTSAFPLYFLRNFQKLGIKKLISTHYSGVVDLFNQGPQGYIFTKSGYKEIYNRPDGYTGSFDDPLSLKILNEEADIVCTNPPFSKMIDFWDIIINSGKKFIIISNIANPITKAYIPYFKNNNVWAGYNRVDWYLNPKKELTEASGHWYTNISIKDRPKYKQLKIVPLKDIPEKYKKFDDEKTLLVDNNYIPNDYKKPFAVSAYPLLSGILEKGYKIIQDKEYYPYINGKKRFARVLVQKI
jgi:hypothetical protein